MKPHRRAFKNWKATLYLSSALLLTVSSPAWAICQANGKTCGNQGGLHMQLQWFGYNQHQWGIWQSDNLDVFVR